MRIGCETQRFTGAGQVLLGALLAVSGPACTRHEAAQPRREKLAEVASAPSSTIAPQHQLPVEAELPSIDGATDWLNSPALTWAGLRGKVVLVDFWTYSCVNWRRTLPYLRAWANKYRSQGLVVIGVRARAAPDEPSVYSAPTRLALNQWALSGNWTIANWSAASNETNARITYRFYARDLHLVMGPIAQGNTVRFRVLVDGQPPGVAHGVDVDAEGALVEQRLYQLIRQPMPIVDRSFEIQFLDSGAEVFSFTFG